jgi:hypothetical protein
LRPNSSGIGFQCRIFLAHVSIIKKNFDLNEGQFSVLISWIRDAPLSTLIFRVFPWPPSFLTLPSGSTFLVSTYGSVPSAQPQDLFIAKIWKRKNIVACE